MGKVTDGDGGRIVCHQGSVWTGVDGVCILVCAYLWD